MWSAFELSIFKLACILLYSCIYPFSGENRMSKLYTSGATHAPITLNELIQAAKVLEDAGQYQEATEMYRQWLTKSRDAHKHLAWFNYGWLLQKQNKVHEASTAYEHLTHDYADYLSNPSMAA
jgi:tetratricopeptide (TPR) repeat protein